MIGVRLTAYQTDSLAASQESADTNLCGEAWWLHGDFFHQTMGLRSCLSAVTKERGGLSPWLENKVRPERWQEAEGVKQVTQQLCTIAGKSFEYRTWSIIRDVTFSPYDQVIFKFVCFSKSLYIYHSFFYLKKKKKKKKALQGTQNNPSLTPSPKWNGFYIKNSTCFRRMWLHLLFKQKWKQH